MFDPRSQEFFEHANQHFAAMRERGPIWTEEFQGQTVHHLFGYELIKDAFSDHLRWSSEIDLFEDLLLKDASILIQDDPPRHTQLREQIFPWLHERMSRTRNNVETQRRVRDVYEGSDSSSIDAVRVGNEIRDLIICDLLGLSIAQMEDVHDWSQGFATGIGIEFLEFEGPRVEAQREFVGIWHKKLDRILDSILENGSAPISKLLATTKSQLSFNDVRALIKTLLFASGHTLSAQITNTLYCFVSNREALKRGRFDGRSLALEALRYKGVFRGSHRLATQVFDLAGAKINVGDFGILWHSSGNFDEQRFADPYNFNPRRKNSNEHLSFGFGIHRCIGAQISFATLIQFCELLIDDPRAMNIISFEVSRDPWVDAFDQLLIGVLDE
ncbi:MAG: cytochrome P450 [Pseudomonadota bacterium]